MQRLLDDFATTFDLDRQIRGKRLGDLIRRAVEDLENRELPDWGSVGPKDRYELEKDQALDFYYAPHLFPGMEVKLRLAHKLQFYMLPREVPAGAPLSIAAVLESYCHLSGDLFGWEPLANEEFLVWIVDLSGHGVRAGLASATLKVLIENLRQRSEVDCLVAELNDTLLGCLRDDKNGLFATGFFMALSADGCARYTSAGHPPVLLRKTDGTIEELESNGLPIGMFPGRRYTATEVRIEPGDTLLLYTDGLVETANEEGELFGIERLRAFMSSATETPRSLTRTLYRQIANYQDMEHLDDDVTFVVARMKPPQGVGGPP